MDSRWCNDPRYGEWTDEVRSQLWTGSAQRDVTCRKPNLLSDGEMWHQTAVAISEPFHHQDVFEQNAAGLLPHPMRALNQDFSSSGKIGGWYPWQQVNGDMSVEETGKLL